MPACSRTARQLHSSAVSLTRSTRPGRDSPPGGGGGGSWVRVYANREHVFAVIAGLRWDTSYSTGGDRTGPGWSEEMRPTAGFRLRHPLGLLAATPLY